MVGIRMGIGLGVSFIRGLFGGGGPGPQPEGEMTWGGDPLTWSGEVITYS